MTTVGDLIEETKRHLYGAYRPEINLLASTIDATTTSVSVADTGVLLGPRSVIGIDDELMYVRAVAGTNLTVIRGYNSTAAAHTADALIELNPSFPNVSIRKALRDDINSWRTDVYQVETVEVTASLTTTWYDLGVDDVYGIVEARMAPSSVNTYDEWPIVGLRLVRSGDFSSGLGVQLLDSSSYAMGTSATRELRVTVAKPFSTDVFTDNVNIETTVGLASSMIDIPPLGALSRLVPTREILRNALEVQGQPRRAEEVQAGAWLQTGTGLMRLRDKRLGEEAARLQQSWPIRYR